jgi:hypothetical protein
MEKRKREKEERKEKKMGKRTTRAGGIRGGARGRSATRARRLHTARGEKRGKNHVGADHGGWSRVGDRPPSGAEWDGGRLGKTERVRATVWRGFDDE